MTARMLCPYVFCSRIVNVEWMRVSPTNPQAERQLILRHDIQHPSITGSCPASLMWIPLDEAAVELLTERAVVDRTAIEERKEKAAERGRPERDEEARQGGTFPIRPLYPRQPGQLPGRMGREPGPHSGVWNPPRPGDPVSQSVPPHAGGQHLGGRMSVVEIAERVTAANIQAGEAAATAAECVHVLGAAKAAVEQAKAQIAGALGQGQSQTLSEYLGLLEQAGEKIDSAVPPLEEASQQLAAGMEKGETYIGILHQ